MLNREEKDIEDRAVRKLNKQGGMLIKQNANLYPGIPDRLLIYHGISIFIEFKTKTKNSKPSNEQLRWHDRLKRTGFLVLTISSHLEVDQLFKDLEKCRRMNFIDSQHLDLNRNQL